MLRSLCPHNTQHANLPDRIGNVPSQLGSGAATLPGTVLRQTVSLLKSQQLNLAHICGVEYPLYPASALQ